MRVVALNDAAAVLGLTTGVALADARARHPAIRAEADNPAADRALLAALADWCDRYTPLVGLDPPDGLLLDVTGCSHLFGGEQALIEDMASRLKRQGLQARLGLADTVGCAWAAARYGGERIVPQGGAPVFLPPLPLAALRLDGESLSAMAQLGLKRIGDVIDRPRGPLAARFGEHLLRRLDQALGREAESIAPRRPAPSYFAERRFADPIGREEDVLGAVEQLARELARRLERGGEGARILELALFRADGEVFRVKVGAAEPLRDPARIARLFKERLAAVGEARDPGFGYDMTRLAAARCEKFDAKQIGVGADDRQSDLAHLIDRLSARFGGRRLTRLVNCDTHIPERAGQSLPAQTGKARSCGRLPEQASLAPARPIRLFDRAEPIEAIAEVPDGPPLRFRWRRALHEVAAAEGPERIAMEWRDAGERLTRDYFRVESRDGLRVWLYREGLYGRETAEPRWFLHGLFA
jgi:protein ImuB